MLQSMGMKGLAIVTDFKAFNVRVAIVEPA